MGRGRAKAKQQKVARELKYNSQSTDLDALQRELGGPHTGTFVDDHDGAEDEDEDDRWTATSP
jgi:Protein of unknown function (DUF3073)